MEQSPERVAWEAEWRCGAGFRARPETRAISPCCGMEILLLGKSCVSKCPFYKYFALMDRVVEHFFFCTQMDTEDIQVLQKLIAFG